jgi:hypothetical protein
LPPCPLNLTLAPFIFILDNIKHRLTTALIF